MNISLITRRQLEIINRKTLRYPLAIAEKDYFLALVCKIIYNSTLKNKLIFKGGTAIYHTYLPQLRFSEDLDFSSNQAEINPQEIRSIFNDHNFLSIKKEYLSQATYKIERLLYTGPLAQPNSLKIEIDFLQNVILPPIKIAYRNFYNIDTKIMVMDIREIVAEKIRAMNDRIRYRDFYDFAMINKKLSLNLKEIIDLVKQKEIRKPISSKNIKSNWQIAKNDKQNKSHSICFSQELDNSEIDSYLSKLNFAKISQYTNEK